MEAQVTIGVVFCSECWNIYIYHCNKTYTDTVEGNTLLGGFLLKYCNGWIWASVLGSWNKTPETKHPILIFYRSTKDGVVLLLFYSYVRCEYWCMILCVFMLMKKSNLNIQLIIFSRECLEGKIQTYNVLFFPLFQQSTFFCARVLFERENLGKQVIWSACGTIHENQQLWQIYVQGCDQKINFTCLGLPKLCTPWPNKDVLKYRK